jgi:shikimate dehydrogenase
VKTFTIEDLRSWSDDTIRLGVIGDPVEHSRSPEMINAALESCGLPHRYAPFRIAPNELRDALELMRRHDFVGCNITVPHKVAALESMDFVDDSASEIGATNTVQFRHGKLRGFNTDAVGFTKAIREEFGVALRDVRVVILGAGGASRALAHVCERVSVWSRRDSTGAAEAIRDAELIVNATPVGLLPSDAPLLTRADFRRDQMVFDTIYSPPRTKLLEEAAAAGARVANGLSMLLHQGAAAFEIWFNRPAPLDAMRAALREFP